MVNNTVIGRIGTIIEVRKENITELRRMLENNNLDECTRKQIERELDSEQDCLMDAMDIDSRIGIIKSEFECIKKEYCR